MTKSATSAKSSLCVGMDLVAPRSSLGRRLNQDDVERDLEIVAAAQAGSTTAFDELQKLYSSRLFKTILRITKNREDAEDALQDTFLRAYVALRGFEARSSVYSWLTRIAINSALMILRRRRSRREALFIASFEEEDDLFPLEIKDPASNPEQLCDLLQRSEHLLHAIRKLEPQVRALIEIRLAGEYSMKEMANILNISTSAVKARLYRARAHLVKRASIQCGPQPYMRSGVAGGESARADLGSFPQTSGWMSQRKWRGCENRLVSSGDK
jgi:RNA polymerase sigma-70 factor, ECF subfamily